VSMLKLASVLVAALAGTVSATAYAADDDFDRWEVRARFVRLDSKGESDPISQLNLPANAVVVNGVSLPEFDISYFFTKHIAAELILTYPQKMNVDVNAGTGIGQIGHVTALPPIITGQYHFMLPQGFDPYVGAGMNLTWLTNVQLKAAPVLPLGLNTSSKFSVGPALQAGLDYTVAKRWVVNADIKYAWITYNLTSNALGDIKVSTLTVNPWLFGIGVGYKF